MKAHELEHIRELLLAKRRELLDRVQRARTTEAEDSDKEAPDLGDRALSTVSRDLLYQLSASERDIVRLVDDALERLNAGTYGTCTSCGKQVQPGRLEAVPWARHCISCQELQDRGEL